MHGAFRVKKILKLQIEIRGVTLAFRSYERERALHSRSIPKERSGTENSDAPNRD